MWIQFAIGGGPCSKGFPLRSPVVTKFNSIQNPRATGPSILCLLHLKANLHVMIYRPDQLAHSYRPICQPISFLVV